LADLIEIKARARPKGPDDGIDCWQAQIEALESLQTCNPSLGIAKPDLIVHRKDT